MDQRTRAYLRGRFGDVYRRTDVTPPPDADRREWGYVPWTEGPGETMVRHRSVLDLGSLEGFLERQRPKHVYFSAGRYETPGASTMGGKRWLSSDLIFDLDADHLPAVNPREDSYAAMLATCKDALFKLLDFLARDFGFEDLTVVFSGGRGYHVHVRDEEIQHLERDARREIVDYVRGLGVDATELIEREAVAGTAGRASPAHKRTLPTDGGWSGRAHRHLIALVEDVLAMEQADAIDRLTDYEGIGERKAQAILTASRENYAELEGGNVDVHPAMVALAKVLIQEAIAEANAPIDEPVTTDTHRLIRLPGSLHGGSGLAVTRLDREELAAFDPLLDAVPAVFEGNDIRVEVTEGGPAEVGGDSFTVDPGVTTVPEPAGVFLMARGRAEKAKE
jgi:DNA primase small subunit